MHASSVTVTENGQGLYLQDVRAGNHALIADEPLDFPGGTDKGPAPYDFLLAALGACTAMTLRMYANQKQWPLQKVSVALTHKKDDKKQDIIDRVVTVEGPLDDAQRARLLEIADKCPVHRTLTHETLPIITSKLA